MLVLDNGQTTMKQLDSAFTHASVGLFVENNKGELLSVGLTVDNGKNGTGILTLTGETMRNNAVMVCASSQDWGLFAARDIEEGEAFLRYDGELLTTHDIAQRRPSSSYIIGFPDIEESGHPYTAIDAYPYVRAGALHRLAGFANHSFLSANTVPLLLNEKNNNNNQPEVYFHATRSIKRGEEILWDYGQEHWIDRAGPIKELGKKHHKGDDDDKDEGGDDKKKKHHLPHLSKKTVKNAKKKAKTAGKVAKVVAPLVLL